MFWVQAMPDAVSSRFSSLDVWYLQDSLSRRERVARLRRVRGARPTILQIDETVGRAALIRRCAPPSPEGRRFTILKQACSIRSYIRSSSELLQLLPDAFIVRINQSGSLICGHRRWSFAPAFQ